MYDRATDVILVLSLHTWHTISLKIKTDVGFGEGWNMLLMRCVKNKATSRMVTLPTQSNQTFMLMVIWTSTFQRTMSITLEKLIIAEAKKIGTFKHCHCNTSRTYSSGYSYYSYR
jgi:hypothetical protein